MLYLRKTKNSKVLTENLAYNPKTPSVNKKICGYLQEEQKNFCAYTEKYLIPLDAVEVEHFDPRLKNTTKDDYWNYYAVLRLMNSKKTNKIDQFEPLLIPYAADLKDRIYFHDWLFKPVNDDDHEAANLIEYLGFNRPELYEDRKHHIERLLWLRSALADDDKFIEHLLNDKRNLSYYSAFRVSFDIEDSRLEAIVTQSF